ncbi:MAG TPA: hypothetical protein VE267_03535 [Bradyrhizobium sp.]|nr:hypothetical protein [Bradyrhizobium sp.]
MTRAITLLALACLLIVGVAATSILGRDSVPAARFAQAPASVGQNPVDQNPVSNKEAKKDRLAVAALALASFEPPQAAVLSEPLRQAYASTAPADDIAMPKMAAPAAAAPAPSAAAPAPAAAPVTPPKPKVVSKPPPQKNYALLSDVQIAGIKERLKLSSTQESYWPPVETALRAVARKIHATRQTDPGATGMPIDPESEEVQQLKSAAMPLLFQLREDQKNEVRSLARVIGLEKVAAMI